MGQILFLRITTESFGYIIRKNNKAFRNIAIDKWIVGAQISSKSNTDKISISPGYAIRKELLSQEYYFDIKNNIYSMYYPGILYIINTETKEYLEWETGQGDSEILFIEENFVYYRVFDKIYKRSIEGNILGTPVLLAKDSNTIPFIHYMWKN
jgi:hypothetical protein